MTRIAVCSGLPDLLPLRMQGRKQGNNVFQARFEIRARPNGIAKCQEDGRMFHAGNGFPDGLQVPAAKVGICLLVQTAQGGAPLRIKVQHDKAVKPVPLGKPHDLCHCRVRSLVRRPAGIHAQHHQLPLPRLNQGKTDLLLVTVHDYIFIFHD